MEYEGEAVEAPAMPTERRSNFDVNKKQARSLQIGDTVTVTVKGEVCGISRGYGLKPADEVYNLEVKFKGMPKVESNAADATLRDMVGEKAPVGRHKNEADKSIDDIFTGKQRAY